ncbi:hypothetical protein D3C87_1535770 [compost metagenome]
MVRSARLRAAFQFEGHGHGSGFVTFERCLGSPDQPGFHHDPEPQRLQLGHAGLSPAVAQHHRLLVGQQHLCPFRGRGPRLQPELADLLQPAGLGHVHVQCDGRLPQQAAGLSGQAGHGGLARHHVRVVQELAAGAGDQPRRLFNPRQCGVGSPGLCPAAQHAFRRDPAIAAGVRDTHRQ